MSPLATYALDGSTATITMDDGKVNALSPQMLAELNDALDRAEGDHAVVVLTGRPKLLSAGFDLDVLNAGGSGAAAMLRSGFELAARILAFPTPVVIACGGHALAMGSFLLLSGDFRVGVDGPAKIGANEVAIGLTMPHAAIEICRQRLATAYFNRAVINAEIFTPAEAVTAGFLDRIVPAGDVLDEAYRVATGLASLDMAAHAATKVRVRRDLMEALGAAIDADDADAHELLS